MIIDIDHGGVDRRIDGPFKMRISIVDATSLISQIHMALLTHPDEEWISIEDNDQPTLDQMLRDRLSIKSTYWSNSSTSDNVSGCDNACVGGGYAKAKLRSG